MLLELWGGKCAPDDRTCLQADFVALMTALVTDDPIFDTVAPVTKVMKDSNYTIERTGGVTSAGGGDGDS